jgi:hypothetical protein
MKKIMFSLLLITVITACNKTEAKKVTPKIVVDLHPEFYGNWVGTIEVDSMKVTNDTLEIDDYESETRHEYSNKVNLILKKVEGDSVFGQSIIKGKTYSIRGIFKKSSKGFTFNMEELEDKKKYGNYEFSFYKNKITGFWYAKTTQDDVIRSKFELTKQVFKYDPNLMLEDEFYVDYYSSKKDTIKEIIDEEEEVYYGDLYRSASDVITKLNASKTVLKEEDLKNLKKLELEIIRNTIFARHGYAFKKENYRQFFDFVDWYIPVSNNVTSALTAVEKENIKLLERFEQYAEDNYDSFGR